MDYFFGYNEDPSTVEEQYGNRWYDFPGEPGMNSPDDERAAARHAQAQEAGKKLNRWDPRYWVGDYWDTATPEEKEEIREEIREEKEAEGRLSRREQAIREAELRDADFQQGGEFYAGQVHFPKRGGRSPGKGRASPGRASQGGKTPKRIEILGIEPGDTPAEVRGHLSHKITGNTSPTRRALERREGLVAGEMTTNIHNKPKTFPKRAFKPRPKSPSRSPPKPRAKSPSRSPPKSRSRSPPKPAIRKKPIVVRKTRSPNRKVSPKKSRSKSPKSPKEKVVRKRPTTTMTTKQILESRSGSSTSRARTGRSKSRSRSKSPKKNANKKVMKTRTIRSKSPTEIALEKRAEKTTKRSPSKGRGKGKKTTRQ